MPTLAFFFISKHGNIDLTSLAIPEVQMVSLWRHDAQEPISQLSTAANHRRWCYVLQSSLTVLYKTKRVPTIKSTSNAPEHLTQRSECGARLGAGINCAQMFRAGWGCGSVVEPALLAP